MSMGNFLEFVDKTLEDDGLLVQRCREVENTTNREETRLVVTSFASNQGIDIDENDAALFEIGMKADLINSGDLPNVELTEEELELVAGGAGGFVIPIRKVPPILMKVLELMVWAGFGRKWAYLSHNYLKLHTFMPNSLKFMLSSRAVAKSKSSI